MPTNEKALQALCLHCHRVISIAEDKVEIYVDVARHLEQDHQITGEPLWIGKDFLLEPAPWRCDLCGVLVELPAWTYYTDPAVTEDPEWLVCGGPGGCHELIHAGRFYDLCKRVMRIQLETLVTDRRSVQQATFPMIRQFLETQTGPPTRILAM